MAAPILIACLVQLRTEFNELAPTRSKASDGWIGDTAHQHEVSDHNPDETGSVPIHDADHINEVHAIDVDSDLRTYGLDMEAVVQFLLARCRSGAEKRLRYIIYNRRIWEASNGWRLRAYLGPSPHLEHAHFSASYDTDKEASTASWHLEDIPVAMTADDLDKIDGMIRAAVAANNDDVWAVKGDVNIGNIQGTGKPSPQTMLNVTRYGSYEHHQILDRLAAATEALGQVAADVKTLLAAVPPTGA